MQPWRIGVGLTATLAGSAFLLVGRQFEFLARYWPVILTENGVAVVWHAGLAIATVSAALVASMYEDYRDILRAYWKITDIDLKLVSVENLPAVTMTGLRIPNAFRRSQSSFAYWQPDPTRLLVGGRSRWAERGVLGSCSRHQASALFRVPARNRLPQLIVDKSVACMACGTPYKLVTDVPSTTSRM